MKEEFTYTKDEVIFILNRLQRSMRTRAVRHLRYLRANKTSYSALYRSQTWEHACKLLEDEMEVLRHG